MVFIIVDDTSNFNRAAINTSGWPTNANGDFEFNVQTGAPFSLSVAVADADGDSLVVMGAGEVLGLASNQGLFAKASGAGNVTGTFNWTPLLGQARVKPYILVFRVMETHDTSVFAFDRTILLNVANFTGISAVHPGIQLFNIYPVPSTGVVNVSALIRQEVNLEIEAFRINGQSSGILYRGKVMPGELNMQVTSKLNPGSYVLRFTLDNQTAYFQKLVVVD
jgi:hypothetical protein